MPDGPLDEIDLYRRREASGWTGELPRLSAADLNELATLVKRSLSIEDRARFNQFVQRAYANFVHDVSQREEVYRQLLASGVFPRSRRRPGATPKLSTLITDEVLHRKAKLDAALAVFSKLSAPMRAEVDACLKGISASPCVDDWDELLFRQARDRLVELLYVVQISAEDAASGVDPSEVVVLASLRDLATTATSIAEDLAGMTEILTDLCTWSWDPASLPPALVAGRHRGTGPASTLCDMTQYALATISESLASIDIAVKSGRAAAPERKLIMALANIYRHVTDREAGRVVRRTDVGSIETGDLLALAQAVVKHVRHHLDDDVLRPTEALSKIVREVLEERRRS